jgi:hypothetical protein
MFKRRSDISQPFWAIEITTEFLFVGMAKVTLAVQQAIPQLAA